MPLAMGSGAGVSATEGVGVVARCNVGVASGSSLHADSAAAIVVPIRAILAIRSQVFRVPSDGITATLTCVAFVESCAKRRGGWWSWGDSNPRPHHCERCALPTELQPRFSPINATTLDSL